VIGAGCGITVTGRLSSGPADSSCGLGPRYGHRDRPRRAGL